MSLKVNCSTCSGVDRLFPRCLETPFLQKKGWGQAHTKAARMRNLYLSPREWSWRAYSDEAMYGVLPRICRPFVMQRCALATENRSGPQHEACVRSNVTLLIPCICVASYSGLLPPSRAMPCVRNSEFPSLH